MFGRQSGSYRALLPNPKDSNVSSEKLKANLNWYAHGHGLSVGPRGGLQSPPLHSLDRFQRQPPGQTLHHAQILDKAVFADNCNQFYRPLYPALRRLRRIVSSGAINATRHRIPGGLCFRVLRRIHLAIVGEVYRELLGHLSVSRKRNHDAVNAFPIVHAICFEFDA